jgi:deazaflavin-dependent oxidoreductase (nitroreductase family)
VEGELEMKRDHADHGATTFRPWRLWRSKALWSVIAAWVLLRVMSVWAFRTQNPAVIGGIKQFNRRWLNPWMLRRAGGCHWYAGRLEHRGRTSGKHYATPLWVDPVDEGFVMPLPYGRDVDWVRNLLAADEAVLQDHGVRYRVANPRIVPAAAVLSQVPSLTRRMVATYGIREFVRVDALPGATAAARS